MERGAWCESQAAAGIVDLTSRRLRLLFLLPFAPRLSGRHGGSRAVGQLVEQMARRHDVAVLHVAEPGDSPVDDELRRLCERIESPLPSARPTSRVGPKLALLRGIPTWASEVGQPGLAERARELALRWSPDIVQIEYPVMGRYLHALAGCPAPRVLVDHDASLRDLREWRGPLPGLTGALDERAWRRFERGVLERVQAAVVHTRRDRLALEALGTGTPVTEIPLATPVPEEPLDPSGGRPPGVLFVGSFVHPANTDAALWLGTTMFPSLRDQHPDARLTIVGPSPPAAVRELTGDGTVVTGEVATVTPYLEDAAVVAAPIRLGGGMRVKVVEALAAGKAIVATPLAVEGLDVRSGEQLVVAATEGEFLHALSRLLGDEQARWTLGRRARAWAEEHLGWPASVGRYERLYDSLLHTAPSML